MALDQNSDVDQAVRSRQPHDRLPVLYPLRVHEPYGVYLADGQVFVSECERGLRGRRQANPAP